MKGSVLWCDRQGTQQAAAGWALPGTFTIFPIKSLLSHLMLPRSDSMQLPFKASITWQAALPCPHARARRQWWS